MRVFGILTLSPSSIWRSSHNYHHKHNSKLRSAHIGSFPIMTKEQFNKIMDNFLLKTEANKKKRKLEEAGEEADSKPSKAKAKAQSQLQSQAQSVAHRKQLAMPLHSSQ